MKGQGREGRGRETGEHECHTIRIVKNSAFYKLLVMNALVVHSNPHCSRSSGYSKCYRANIFDSFAPIFH